MGDEIIKQPLNYGKQTKSYWRGDGLNGWCNTHQEGTCDEQWVFYGSDELLSPTIETNTLWVNSLDLKEKLGRVIKNKNKKYNDTDSDGYK